MSAKGAAPRAVVLSAAFFAGAGILEIGLGWSGSPRPLAFWRLWDPLCRGLLHFVVAAGLARRVALCRTFAMVYCLASLVTYAVVLALALGHAPFLFPHAIVVQSLYEVPLCAVLFPYLRSREAAAAFTRPLF